MSPDRKAPRAPWLTIVGIGEDGLDGLSAEALAAVEAAEVLVGGERHLAKAAGSNALKMGWGKDFEAGVEAIRAHEGKRIVVLASGDPMHYGAGATLVRRFGLGALRIIPTPGAFSLAAARMGWSLPDVTCLTVHGRALERVNLHLAPGARMIVLSWDGRTPGELAALLAAKGYGESRIQVFEHMGGADERHVEGTAVAWPRGEIAALNTVCVECVAGPDVRAWSRAPGLSEDAFAHDNMITKREVRAVTLALLGPLPGETLWDIGAGSGTVAVEWLRLEPHARAVAIERDATRLANIRANAGALGVPELEIVEGSAPEALAGIGGAPDAVFVGGGVSDMAVLDAAWKHLKPRGRLVANAVTLDAQEALLAFRKVHGGELSRISVAREGAVGRLAGFRPAMEVWQLRMEKS
ncbi:MAG: precorrin-6y C5,15-methyltransferase (decarboxylating) subunit CbiE [Rhodospirillaceae bacterium]